MRNIRLLVEFAAIIIPGAVLLMGVTALFASSAWIEAGSYNSAGGIAAAIAISFALGHLLQGLAQTLVEPAWRRLHGGGPAAWAVYRFRGHENRRYLTPEQLEQVEQQFPLKLAVPFPRVEQAADRLTLDCMVAHLEAYVETAKAAEGVEDYQTDLRFSRGCFAAFLLLCLAIPFARHEGLWLEMAGMGVAALAAFVRMDRVDRKYMQSLFLVFLTAPSSREGGGRGAGAGGGMGGGMPLPLPRGGGMRHGDFEEEH